MNDYSLNLFFGTSPSNEFLEDFEILKKIPEKEIFELVDDIINIYSKENINEELKNWEKKFGKNQESEKKEKERALKVLLYLLKEFSSENVTEDEIRDDFKNLEISTKILDRFIKNVKPVEKEFRKNSLRNEKPYENVLVSIDWRLENKIYRDSSEKKVAKLEFIYSDKGEKKVAQFDLNQKALKHLIYRLQKIKEVL